MKSSLTINPKFLGMALIAAALSLALFQFVSVKPLYAASGCRELAVSIGGCGGPSDETCILEYCAGKAFEDIMDEVHDEARKEMKKENKEETEEEVSEDTIGTNGTCDVGGGTNCILFSYFTDFCVFNGGVPSVTLGGVPIPFSIGDGEFEITVADPSVQELKFSCGGDGGFCFMVLEVLAGAKCIGDPFEVNIESPGSKTFTCFFPPDL